ncbi:MAG: hypothetical protein WCO18_00435 [bacterium]
MFFQYYSSNYSTAHSTQFVGDIFLDNMPTINMNPIIVEGALISLALGILLVLSKPRYIIFTIKTFAIFVTLRSFFVAATHLGIYPDQIVPSKGFFDQIYLALNLESGYFFSAHTGLPFLMGLIFVKDPFWRNIFFAMSCLFGVSVLLAHVHYSIDVFAAPFMTYSVYKMSVYLFKEDYKLIESE